MSSIVTLFQANLNANNIYIDYSNLPDPITHKFWLLVKNQYTSTLYFKISSYIDNWTMTSPSDGKLGGISPASQSVFTIIMTREKPSEETTDTGYFKIEVFSDSNYTVKVGEATLNVTVYIEDLENWTDVTIYDFNDGTSQGWTLSSGLSISNERSIEPTGYSIKGSITNGDTTQYIEKTITLPNRNKVRINFYKSFRFFSTSSTTRSCNYRELSVKVNDVKVLDFPFVMIYLSIPGYASYSYGWWKFCLDLSEYKGRSVTLRIEWKMYSEAYIYSEAYLDRIVIAGKD
jgi:hypothetical protein